MMRASTVMGSGALTMRSLTAYDCLIPSGCYTQSVRWKRKPIWLPTAKTKIFRVPKRPQIPKEELMEIQRLYNNYRTLMKSVLYYFHVEGMKNKKTTDETSVKNQEEKDFVKCMAINDAWNQERAKEREIRLEEEWKQRAAEIVKKLEKKKERDAILQVKIDEKVREVKEIAHTFITPENIDEAIEESLETIVNHNRAIDINGNFYDDTTAANVNTSGKAEAVATQ